MVLARRPALIIDYNTTHQIVNMSDFWEVAPKDLFDVVQATNKTVKPDAACTSCGNLKTTVLPVHNAFWSWIANAIAVDLTVDWLVTFIITKRGYRPDSIRVYYRNAKGFRRLLVL